MYALTTMANEYGNFGSVAFAHEDWLFVRAFRSNPKLKGAKQLFYAKLFTGGSDAKGPNCNLKRYDDVYLQSTVDPESLIKQVEGRIVGGDTFKIIAQGCIGCAVMDKCKLIGEIPAKA